MIFMIEIKYEFQKMYREKEFELGNLNKNFLNLIIYRENMYILLGVVDLDQF